MAEVPSPEELESLGIYDPAHPRADERLEMLQYLFTHGATAADVELADATGGLGALAAELSLRLPGERLDVTQAAERHGMTEDALRGAWRALGFPDPVESGERFSTGELDALVPLLQATDALVGGESNSQLIRVFGAVVARLAESEVAALRVHYETPTRSAGATDVDVARSYEAMVQEVLPVLNAAFDVVHRRHIVEAARQLWSVDPDLQAATATRAVGFADAVGFTRRSRRLSTGELAASVSSFEDRIANLVTSGGGRLVKLIGDEAMFVAGDAAAGARLALDLLATFEADEDLPPLRIGLGYGEVVTMHGDYYGDVVNLASRLTEVARASTVVVSPAVRDALEAGDEFRFTELPPLALKGFGRRVRAHRLRTRT